MDFLTKLLERENLSNFYFIVSLIFLSQFFNLIPLDLSSFKNFFIFSFLENHKQGIIDIFKSICIFSFYCIILRIFQYIVAKILRKFKIEYTSNKELELLNVIDVFIYINLILIFCLEFFFILFKFKIISYAIFDYSNFFDSLKFIITQSLYSINNFIYFIYFFILLLLQLLGFKRVLHT